MTLKACSLNHIEQAGKGFLQLAFDAFDVLDAFNAIGAMDDLLFDEHPDT